jgi:plastocyanin
VRGLALLAALLSCLLAACGGGEEKKKAARTETVAASKGLRVVGREYSFNPENVVVTGGGGPLKITLDNKGSLAHNLKVEKDGSEIGGTPTFASGESQSGTVKLAPGSYTFICTVGNHADLGMKGKLTVKR